MSQKFITKWERDKLVQMEDVISQSEAKSYFKVERLFERWGWGGGGGGVGGGGQLFKSTR